MKHDTFVRGTVFDIVSPTYFTISTDMGKLFRVWAPFRTSAGLLRHAFSIGCRVHVELHGPKSETDVVLRVLVLPSLD